MTGAGQFLLSFGEYGDRAGQFISPFHLIALEDGTVLVADKAKYKKGLRFRLTQTAIPSVSVWARSLPHLSQPFTTCSALLR